MLLSSVARASEPAPHSQVVLSPIAVGGISLVILLVMLIAVLMFGKGREHS